MYDCCILFTPSFEGCAAPGTARPAYSIPSPHVYPEPRRACPEPREVRRVFMRFPATLLALSFQSLPTIKLNYPTRIVHPERSEGSLCEREVGLHPNPFRLYYFQQLTTIKFCNHVVLITIQNAGEVGGLPADRNVAPFRSSSLPYILPSSVSSNPFICHSYEGNNIVDESNGFCYILACEEHHGRQAKDSTASHSLLRGRR